MRQSPPPARRPRLATALSGLALCAGSGVATEQAWAHMAAAGVICGGATAHCGWCYAAPALLLAGLAALAAAVRPTPRRARVSR